MPTSNSWLVNRSQQRSLLAIELDEKTKVVPLTIGVSNVRTLMDNAGSDIPQCKNALVSRELGRYKIEIAAMCETHLAVVGEIREDSAGYSFFF